MPATNFYAYMDTHTHDTQLTHICAHTHPNSEDPLFGNGTSAWTILGDISRAGLDA